MCSLVKGSSRGVTIASAVAAVLPGCSVTGVLRI
jgi:hypothetical protein